MATDSLPKLTHLPIRDANGGRLDSTILADDVALPVAFLGYKLLTELDLFCVILARWDAWRWPCAPAPGKQQGSAAIMRRPAMTASFIPSCPNSQMVLLRCRGEGGAQSLRLAGAGRVTPIAVALPPKTGRLALLG
nr:hypothetical protein [uncultured Sphingomonas sp.]